MKSIAKLTLSLTIICAIAGALLTFVNTKTKAPKEKAQAAQKARQMLMVMNRAATIGPALFVEGNEFHRAYDSSGRIIGSVAEGRDPNGFGGEIRVLVGINADDTIAGVLVSSANETPGIGSRVCERSQRRSLWDVLARKKLPDAHGALPKNSYLDSYTGKALTPGHFAFGSDHLKPVSGATISSTAVLKAIDGVRNAYQAARPKLFQEGN